jgi:hypothetical protein
MRQKEKNPKNFCELSTASIAKQAHLNLNSPLLAGGMNIECDLFLIIGLTQLSRRDTPQLAAGRVHLVESEITFGIPYLPQGVHRRQPENKVFFSTKYESYIIHVLD